MNKLLNVLFLAISFLVIDSRASEIGNIDKLLCKKTEEFLKLSNSGKISNYPEVFNSSDLANYKALLLKSLDASGYKRKWFLGKYASVGEQDVRSKTPFSLFKTGELSARSYTARANNETINIKCIGVIYGKGEANVIYSNITEKDNNNYLGASVNALYLPFKKDGGEWKVNPFTVGNLYRLKEERIDENIKRNDFAKAKKHIDEAKNINDLSEYLYEHGSYSEKITSLLLRKINFLAENGDARAQFKLYEFYKRNKFEDNRLSEFWLSQSAKNGYAKAQFIYGNKVFLGRVTKKIDKQEGTKLIYMSSEKGFARASELIGKIKVASVIDGEVAAGDISEIMKEALFYFKKAYLQGGRGYWSSFAEGRSNITNNDEAMIYSLLDSLEVWRRGANRQQLYSWYSKKAEAGSSYAQFIIGEIARIRGDYDNAEKWYSKSANQGDQYAQYQLAHMYATYDKKNKRYIHSTDSLKYLKKSADQSNRYAQYEMGMEMERVGKIEEAIEWYQLARENGHTYAHSKIAALKGKKRSKI